MIRAGSSNGKKALIGEFNFVKLHMTFSADQQMIVQEANDITTTQMNVINK